MFRVGDEVGPCDVLVHAVKLAGDPHSKRHTAAFVTHVGDDTVTIDRSLMGEGDAEREYDPLLLVMIRPNIAPGDLVRFTEGYCKENNIDPWSTARVKTIDYVNAKLITGPNTKGTVEVRFLRYVEDHRGALPKEVECCADRVEELQEWVMSDVLTEIGNAKQNIENVARCLTREVEALNTLNASIINKAAPF
jgi:hypothetical protein